MKMKSIAIKGYRCISALESLELKDLSQRNILIGPNNSGKSTVFRFLHYLVSSINNMNQTDYGLSQMQDEIDESWWWQYDTTREISACIVLNGDISGSDINPSEIEKFVNDEECRLSISLVALENNKCHLIIAPNIWHDGWLPVVKRDPGDASREQHLNNEHKYIYSHASDNCPYHEVATKLVRVLANSIRFFDPIRATDRGPGDRRMSDGSGLLRDLFNRQQDRNVVGDYYRFTKCFLDEINKLFGVSGAGEFKRFEMKGSSEDPQLYLSLQDTTAPIALENMGTGVAELIILFTELVRDKDLSMLYCIEEPEIHLHPGLLRRLFNSLINFANKQFFISSHSNVILDGLIAEDRVFHLHQKRDGSCIAKPCKRIIEQQTLLDSLGVSGSTLLQTNCVIWVEGPSDRMFVNHWLQELQKMETDLNLQEGSDYAYVFYGGKILSHFTFDSDEQSAEDLLSIIKVSRYSAVLMDKDLSPSQSEDELRFTKCRIIEAAEHDQAHRLAMLTEGREIENDFPEDVLRLAFSDRIGFKEADSKHGLPELNLTGEKRYPDEVIEHLNYDDEDAKSFKRKLSNKVALARDILFVCQKRDKSVDIPSYIERLKVFIIKSRVLEVGDE